jgi:hypothetical protein
MPVSALFHSSLANEESRVSALVRKSVRTIDPDESTPMDLDAALMSTFGPDAIERTGAIPDYNPEIPEGAQT